MTTVEISDEFQIGRVVSRLFDVLIKNAGVFLPIALILQLPVLALSLLGAFQPELFGKTAAGGINPATLGLFFLVAFAVFIVYASCTYILQAALVQGSISYMNDAQPSFGECLVAGLRYFVPLVVIAILSSLGMMLGFVLLVIPGVILALMWMVVVPVKVMEATTIRTAFGRSRALTKGHRGAIFLLAIFYFVLAIAVSLATRPLFGLPIFSQSAGGMTVPLLVVQWIENTILVAIAAVGVSSIYYELRLVKEGVGAQQMAAAFD
jgi:hypothetical protein